MIVSPSALISKEVEDVVKSDWVFYFPFSFLDSRWNSLQQEPAVDRLHKQLKVIVLVP